MTTTTTYTVTDLDDGCEAEITAETPEQAARAFVRRGDYQAEEHTVTVRLRVLPEGGDELDVRYIKVEVPPPMTDYPRHDEECEEDDGGTSLGYYDLSTAQECADAAMHNLSLMPYQCSGRVGKIEEYERAGKTIYWVTVVYP